ncbi:UAA transporter family protein [Skeletonema marinoi]|uniref:UAA transporter family protein n=1 Tax=Skeletonema marinoi TaxID=267567 RepID=A0AAD9D6K3_9STRA|nr:UAA transporter family protein [Skeletonema marinoi]
MTQSTEDNAMSFELSARDGASATSEADKAPLLPIHDVPADAASPASSLNVGSSAATNNDTKSRAMQLLFGAGGIYASFLYYGSLQEDVFRYESEDGTKFTHAWYLQVLESLANVIFGTIALIVMGASSNSKNSVGLWWGGTPNLPKKPFVSSGFSQVCSKAFTSLALANGLSFPVATLAKSGKMAPVMLGSLILGGATYGLREYLQVLAIIGGTAILSMSKKKASTSESTPLGAVFILLALVMDGVTGGVQKRLLADMKRVQVTPQPYDLMTYTNLFMMLFALLISFVLGEFTQGIAYCASNPKVFSLIWKFSMCSAIGQSFIFYTVARFDPLVCSTVTTTRKILSVLYSILFKGHSIAGQGWLGLLLAIGGIASEVVHKAMGAGKKKLKSLGSS